MTQLWSGNLIFFIFKNSDTALIQASMAYCAHVIGNLFYLLEKIMNRITNFLFLLLTFLIPDFFFLFYVMDFLGIYTFYMLIAFQDVPDTFLSDKYFWKFHSSDFPLSDTVLLLLSYHDISFYRPAFSLWIVIIFFLASKSLSLPADSRFFFSSYLITLIAFLALAVQWTFINYT